MRRLVVLVAVGVALLSLGGLACGDKTDKPPLTPDQEHMTTDGAEGGAPSGATPATPATSATPATPATPPKK